MFQLFGFRSRALSICGFRADSDKGGLCPSDRLESGPGNTFPDSSSLAVEVMCLLWINALNPLPCYWAAPKKNQLWVSTSLLLNIPANYSLSTTTWHHSKNNSQGPWPSSQAHTTGGPSSQGTHTRVCRRLSVACPPALLSPLVTFTEAGAWSSGL